ncbi:hypothetical protein M885DRAFT_406028, partial [Pelagophyceae sp. CCMP2097]
NYSHRHEYLISLYWVFTTMTTVGYGDVPVVSNSEKTFAIFAMIVGGACFGYIIGNVTRMLENFDQGATLYRERIEVVKDYLGEHDLPPHVVRRVVR